MFLSVFPVKIKNFEEKKLSESISYFPLVGLGFGLVLASLYKILSVIAPSQVISLILVASLVIMDRGLHLDGLGDTADGLFGGKTKEQSLKIMSDTKVGSYGIIAIALIIFSQFTLLESIKPAYKIAALIFMPAAARFSVSLASYLFKPAKSEGLAMIFAENKITRLILATLFMTLVVFGLLYYQIEIWPVILGAFLAMLVIPYFLVLRIGGVTGDIFGALIELNQVAILFLFVLLK